MSITSKLKAEWASKGFYYLDHTPTGKVYTGTAANMFEAIKDLKGQIDLNVCKDKGLTKLCEKESEFTVCVQPCNSIGDARKAEKQFRASKPSYLLIN